MPAYTKRRERGVPVKAATIAPLLRLRLRWYAVATARLLLRRWQGVALLAGVLGAANDTLFGNVRTFAVPLLAMLDPRHGIAWRCAGLLALQAVALLWAGLQRRQIEGGDFMAYAGALPFTPRQRRRVDLAVLLLADSPLLLMVAGAMATAPMRAPFLAAVALLALTAQVALLERRRGAWLGVGAGCLLLAFSAGTRIGLAVQLLTGAVAMVALGAAPWPRPRRRRTFARVPAAADAGWLLRTVAGRHAPALRISLAVLLRERRGELLAKCVLAGAIVAAALALVAVFERDGRSFPTLLLAGGALAFTMSGLFRGLHMAHAASLDFSAALPLPRRWWRVFDLAAVLAAALPFLAVPALVALALGAAPARVLAGLLSYAALLCALRAPQLLRERHAVVLSAAVAAAWTAATLASLT